ncbi:uncharacterized protein LOC126902296 [Daktulosphaira vitifoliae]|uniref:uncharacterized protein LOC126902296 n=1 Tax=Daktulosphaira vitifoliae TaxID=58002 RepID=UPI0021A980FD|nr:uncharacterized protein LOC126902296 [Daktulosphaira vitifoliae]
MLLKNIKKSKSDVEKLYHTFELVRCYMRLGVDYFKECRSMAKQCLELSENINSHTWTVNSLVWLALAECRLGNKLECYRKINVAFNISKQLKEPGVTLFLEKMRSVISDLDVARLNQNEKRKAEIVNFMPNLETKMKAMYMFRQLDTMPEDRQMSLVPGISLTGVNSKYTSSKAAHKYLSIIPGSQAKRLGVLKNKLQKNIVLNVSLKNLN